MESAVKHIFFTINSAQTKLAIKKHIDAYNKKIKLESPETAKKEVVKANILHTANKIVEEFTKHIATKTNYEIAPSPDEFFKTNNGILAVNTGLSKPTIWRHITILQKCGVISDKVFRGSKASYRLDLNAQLVVLNNNYHFQEMVIAMFKKYRKISEIDELTDHTLRAILPQFSDFPQACMITSCNHILKEHLIRINIIEGVDVKNIDSLSMSSERNTKARAKAMPVTTSVPPIEEKQEAEIFPPGREKIAVNNSVESEQIKQIAKERAEKNRLFTSYTYRAYLFVVTMLWRNQNLAPSQIQALKSVVRSIFFEPIEQNKSTLVLERLENEFYTRISLQREALDRSPERFVPIPSKYFDPEFAHGFEQTGKWFTDHLAKKKRNKDWNSNARLVADLYKVYMKTESSIDFLNGLQTLKKKRNPRFAEMYCELCQDSSKFKHQFFANNAQQYLQQNNIAV